MAGPAARAAAGEAANEESTGVWCAVIDGRFSHGPSMMVDDGRVWRGERLGHLAGAVRASDRSCGGLLPCDPRPEIVTCGNAPEAGASVAFSAANRPMGFSRW